jgi:hypothetical protein
MQLVLAGGFPAASTKSEEWNIYKRLKIGYFLFIYGNFGTIPADSPFLRRAFAEKGQSAPTSRSELN